MNELHVSLATHADAAAAQAATPKTVVAKRLAPVEFVGSSDETIAEAVRRALSRASISLRTLDGAGVVVIPQIERLGARPRFRVTLRVTQPAPEVTPQRG